MGRTRKNGLLHPQQTVLVDLLQAELLVELGHASAGIHQLLLTGEEGVTLEQTSTLISFLVEPVSITLPQAQVIVVC